MVFPDVLPRLQRYTDEQLKLRIGAMYWLQALMFSYVRAEALDLLARFDRAYLTRGAGVFI